MPVALAFTNQRFRDWFFNGEKFAPHCCYRCRFYVPAFVVCTKRAEVIEHSGKENLERWLKRDTQTNRCHYFREVPK